MTRYADPFRHSRDGFPPESIPYQPSIGPPGQRTVEEEVNPPEGGSVAVALKSEGHGLPGTIIGVVSPTEKNEQQTQPGNNPVSEWLDYATNLTQLKHIPPNMVEKIVNGALVRVPEEKGQEWMHSLTKGIRTSATELPILGQFLEEFKEIPTALQKYAEIPTGDLISQLPGEIMNIANTLKNMTSEQKSKATQNMNSTVLDAFNSLATLSTDTTSSGAFVTSGRVNPEKFLENIVGMLSEVRSYDDLIDAMDRMRTDKSIRGMEDYFVRTFTGLTANTANTPNGEIYFELSDDVSESKIFFDDGFSMNVNNKTYTVNSASQNSRNVFVKQTITENLQFARVYVYSPVLEFQMSDTFGTFDMTMDLNGNISATKESKAAKESVRSALTGQKNSGQAGGIGQSLFDTAAGKLSDMIDRIPNNTRKELIEEIRTRAKKEIDGIVKNTLGPGYPFQP